MADSLNPQWDAGYTAGHAAGYDKGYDDGSCDAVNHDPSNAFGAVRAALDALESGAPTEAARILADALKDAGAPQ